MKNNNDEEVRMLMEFVFWESSEEEDYTTIAHVDDQSLVCTIFVSIT